MKPKIINEIIKTLILKKNIKYENDKNKITTPPVLGIGFL
jgi:hypothetical protein